MAYAQYTLAELRTQLEAKWEGKPFWVAAEANLAINEGLKTWNMLTGRWKRRVIINTTKNTVEYALPSTLLYRTRLTHNGVPLSPSGLGDLNLGRPTWLTETTTSGGDVPTRPTLWAPVSLQLIVIWPADALSHNSLTVDGVAATPVLTADGDFVDLGEDDLSVLLGFALHVASFKKGGPWFAATMPYYQQFLQAAAQENKLLTTSLFYRRAMGVAMRDIQPILSPSVPTSLGDLIAGSRGASN